jgi:hypothetical protein
MSILKTITAQPVYMPGKNKPTSGSIRLQDVALEPGVKYEVFVTKVGSDEHK